MNRSGVLLIGLLGLVVLAFAYGYRWMPAERPYLLMDRWTGALYFNSDSLHMIHGPASWPYFLAVAVSWVVLIAIIAFPWSLLRWRRARY